MSKKNKSVQNVEPMSKIDEAIYLNFVDTLFSDRKHIAIGLMLQLGVMLCIFLDLRAHWVLPIAAAITAIAVWRLVMMARYHKYKALFALSDAKISVREAQRWEMTYTASSVLAGGILGINCFVVMNFSTSLFSTIAAVSLIFATLPSIVGRLYGSRRLALLTTMALLVPPSMGLFISFDAVHLLFLVLTFPFGFLIYGLVSNVRATVVHAVRGEAKASLIAGRMDEALTNMSHGLMMLDADQNLDVINVRAFEIFGIKPTARLRGKPVVALLRLARRSAHFSPSKTRKLEAIMRRVTKGDGVKERFALNASQLVDFSASKRAGGGLVLLIEDVTAQVIAERRLEIISRRDAVTGLPNYEYFSRLVNARMALVKGSAKTLMITFCVDDFKRVCDTIGYVQADRVLYSVGRRAKSLFGSSALLCKLGGDEFVIFDESVSATQDPNAYAAMVAERLGGYYEIGGERVNITVSCGYAEHNSADFNFASAMADSSLALGVARSISPGHVAGYDPSIEARFLRRQKIKAALIEAIETNALSVLYQPLIDARTGRLAGCEVLSRWQDPVHGIVGPAEFIPLAEEMGIVHRITEAVLRKATSDCAHWPDHLSVSVNFSAQDFMRAQAADMVRVALDNSGLAPHRLEIEVTETAVAASETMMIEQLEAIKALGVKIVLDDFGTGYSTFAYLQNLPFDRVKIDRSFLVNIENSEGQARALFNGLINLCVTLGKKITVEGVETEEQLSAIHASGNVSRMQGFLFGMALPSSAIGVLGKASHLIRASDAVINAVNA